MADLFLPPMTPFTPDQTTNGIPGDSATSQELLSMQHNLATNRELTLQTPAPPKTNQEYESEDATLSWVRSLPSPFSPFDEFGEVSSFSQEYAIPSIERSSNKTDNIAKSISESLFTAKYLPVNTTTQKSNEQTFSTQRNLQTSEEPVKLTLTNSCSKSSLSIQTNTTVQSKNTSEFDDNYITKTTQPPNAVIDLTENLNDKTDVINTVTNERPPSARATRKRPSELGSPNVEHIKKRILGRATGKDVIEVRETYTPNERSSSVESYCSTSSEMMLSPSSCPPTHRMMRDIVRRYLKRLDEMRIIILHAKVVQKSYGSEKRFFCPPPCIRLVGNGWKTKQRRKNVSSSSTSSPMPSPAAINSPMPTTVMKASDVCAFIGVGGGDLQQLHLDHTKKYAAAKNLHTPDSDKRKHFQLHVKMFYGDGTEIGKFLSQRIKVISKPSKKKQTVKNPELCIASGTKVSFFNRLRSQTVSTRYLFATRKGYCASSTQWGAFSIYLARDDEDDRNRFDAIDGYIHYGNPVKLVCSVTGIALPRIVIRKVDKQDAIIDTDEPISQLHRCAMFLHNTKRQYLCLSQDKVIAHTATPNSRIGNMDRLNDGSCWTIISTEKAEYCWSDSSLHLANSIGVTPVPVVHSLQINGGGQVAMVELIGENFSPNLTLWFSTVEANTMYRCEECLLCVVPEISKIKPDWKFIKEPIKVPLILTRDDGLLYPTHIDFYYTPEPGPKDDPHPTVREILRSKQFINNM